MKASLLLIPLALAAASCASAPAKTDLPVANQTIDTSPVKIYSFPDGFPNIAFRCIGTTGVYTTTRDGSAASAQLIPNDKNCTPK